MLNRSDKQQIISSLNEVGKSAQCVVLAHYSGMTANEFASLRSKARESGVHVQVARNNLAKIAFKDTNYECLSDQLKGPVAIFFALQDVKSAAKVVYDFSKENSALACTSVAIQGMAYGTDKLVEIAKLPSLEQAYAMLASGIQGPVQNLAMGLKEVYARIARVISKLPEQVGASN